MVDVNPRYKELFIHRDDVFAVQQANGSYFPLRRPITEDDIADHLLGFWSIGTYVIRPTDQTVRYIVFDLDTHDQAQTKALRDLVSAMAGNATDGGLTGPDGKCLLMERSGNKGVHVWLFLDAPIPARQARAWIVRDFFPGWRALGYRDLEVFPKQDTVDEGGFGNLVKLPLGVHAVTGNKSEFILTQGWASDVNDVVPLDAALVPALEPDGASTHPASSGAGQQEPGGRLALGARGRPSTRFACIDLALSGPVGEGYRNRMMTHLALYLFGHGMAEDLAVEQCLRANENYDPPLSEREVRTCVRSAFRGRKPGAGCKGQSWLQDICPGPCDQVGVTASPNVLYDRAQPGSTVIVDVVERIFKDGKVRLKLSHPDAENTPAMIVRPPNE